MSVKASRERYGFDSDLVLRPYSSTAVATEAVTVNDGININELGAAYWHDGEIPGGNLVIGVQVTSADDTTGDETYTITAYVDAVAAMSTSPVAVGSIDIVRGTSGMFYFSVSAEMIEAVKAAGDTFLGFALTSSGTTPLLAFGVRLCAIEQ
jgi:hypothetical protein